MNKRCLLMAMSLLLYGCDQFSETGVNTLKQDIARDAMKIPSIVIYPGWTMDDHGKPATVYGTNLCPEGIFSNMSENGCLVIEPADKTVTVSVLAANSGINKAQHETWLVERSGAAPDDVIRLKRPDKTYISEWKGTSGQWSILYSAE